MLRSRSVVVAMVASLLLAACGGGGGGGPAAPGGVAAGEADRNAEYVMALGYQFASLDPHRTTSPVGDRAFMRPMYDGLLEVVEGDDGPELGPELATSFEVSEDGRRISFVLRDDVTFQDGTPFDADAVKANIERAQDPESTIATSVDSIETVEVVDDTHVVFHLNAPDPGLPWAMAIDTAGLMTSPAAFDADLATKPVGTGPFTLVSAQQGGDIVYERWDDHWDPNAALVRKLTISTVTDGNARYSGLRSRRYDTAHLTSPQDVQAKDLENQGYNYLNVVSGAPIGILLNPTMPPFDDVRVRRATAMALNRAQIAETVFGDQVPPFYQPIGEGYIGHDPSLDQDPYDPEQARDLIEQAGAEGTKVTLIQQLVPPFDALAEVAQEAFGEIGLEVELLPLAGGEARPTWHQGRHHAMSGVISVRPDPSQTMEITYLGEETPGNPDPQLHEMAERAAALPFDSDEREKAYQEISRYLVDNAFHVPVAGLASVVVSRPEVVGAENLFLMYIGMLDFRGVGVTG